MGLTSLISLCDCCKLCTVGCAVWVVAMTGLNVGLGCGLGTDTGVLLTGGCCFFLSESYKNRDPNVNMCVASLKNWFVSNGGSLHTYLVANWTQAICSGITIETASRAAHGLHWIWFTFHSGCIKFMKFYVCEFLIVCVRLRLRLRLCLCLSLRLRVCA